MRTKKGKSSSNYASDWLLYEKGTPFSDLLQTIMDELCKQYECDGLNRSLIEEYLKLDAGSRRILKDYIRNVFNPIAEAESVEDKINVEAKQTAMNWN